MGKTQTLESRVGSPAIEPHDLAATVAAQDMSGELLLRDRTQLFDQHPGLREDVAGIYRSERQADRAETQATVSGMRSAADYFATVALEQTTWGSLLEDRRPKHRAEDKPVRAAPLEIPAQRSAPRAETVARDEIPPLTPELESVLTKKQRRQIDAAAAVGTVLSPWELLSSRQLKKARQRELATYERQRQTAMRSDAYHASPRYERDQASSKWRHERRKLAPQAIGSNALHRTGQVII